MRLDCGVIVKREPSSVSTASGVNIASCGPSSTRRHAPPAGIIRALPAGRAATAPAGPTGNTSPAASARPPNGPMRLTRLVARLPSV